MRNIRSNQTALLKSPGQTEKKRRRDKEERYKKRRERRRDGYSIWDKCKLQLEHRACPPGG